MRLTIIACLLSLYATQAAPRAAPSSAATAGEWPIVPGKSLGYIRVGEDAEKAQARLGRADTGEGAAGHSWATWFAKSDRAGRGRSELDVYTTLAEGSAGGKIVRIVRATSPSFHTRDGVSTRSDLGRIRKTFPGIRRVAAYQPVPGGPAILVYDETRRGITFEVMQGDGLCTAISVHAPGRNPMDETMRMTLYVRSVHERILP